MKRIQLITLALVIVSTLYAGSMFAVGSSQPVRAEAENCQYPGRDTNPENGCDNSDPACPETIKFGYDCEPKTQPEPVVQPTTPVVPVTPVAEPTTPTCGK